MSASGTPDASVFQLQMGRIDVAGLFGWLAEDVYRAMGLDSSRVPTFQEYLQRYGELDRKRQTEGIDDNETVLVSVVSVVSTHGVSTS